MPSPIAGRPSIGIAAIVALCALTSASLAQHTQPNAHTHGAVCANCCADQPELTPEQQAARDLIEAQTFFALPQAHQDVIVAKLIERGEKLPSMNAQSMQPNPKLNGRDIPLTRKEFESAWATVEIWEICTREEFASFKPVHQRMIVAMCEHVAQGKVFMAAPCFVPGTDPNLVETVSNIISYGRVVGPQPRFEQITRWVTTASNPSGTGQQGTAVTLTYSFPPDGTFVASGVGEGDGFNDLNAFFDGIYGDRATWRAIYDDMFARWGELSGNTYILETNDDGANVDFNENVVNGLGIDPFPGVLGVRGDLRMIGKAIDGNSGTLAYNFFPEMGDMVIDTSDNFYTDTSNNSIRLRNILAHEHGHGMGQLHTCPIQENKLMEPFISVAFDGPQFDDVLNAQRHYGDPNEPNDTPATATSLGNLGISQSASVGDPTPALGDPTGTVTIDDDQDIDYYSFTLPQSAEVTLTFTPRSFTYQAGPQTFFCDETQTYNPLVFLNPVLELLDTDGTTVLEIDNNSPAGTAESIVRTLPAGTYFARLTGTNPNGDEIIAYTFDVDTDLPGFIPAAVAINGGLPTTLTPGQSETVSITVTENNDTLVGAPTLNYRRASDPSFTSVNFVSVGGNDWEATLPALECADDPELFVQATFSVEGARNFPASGNVTATLTTGGAVLVDNVETNNLGWTTENTAIEGQWERGVPQNNGRDDPPADFDGSGQCWLTGQEPADTNSDVDGGFTRLISPVFDFSNGGTISYAYWANDTVNPIGPEDGFSVDYSIDGGTNWIQIRSYATAGNWRTDTIDVTAEIGTPASLRIRFVAADEDPGNVLECAVDNIVFDNSFCEQTSVNTCLGDFDNDGDVDLGDFGIFGSAFGSVTGDANYHATADFDNDGDVDLGDFGIFGGEFGRTDCIQ
ncbi:MAG: hypothetical protein Tsb0013_01000 [Phycisphaerales bacterium]